MGTIEGMFNDDITFCPEQCDRKDCMRNSKNIRDKTVPHSYYAKRPDECPKRESAFAYMTEPVNGVSDVFIRWQGGGTNTLMITTNPERLTDDQVMELFTIVCIMQETGKILRIKRILGDAIDLLKEREPVKPIKQKQLNEYMFSYACGKCGTFLMPLGTSAQYCYHCGTAVKWE